MGLDPNQMEERKESLRSLQLTKSGDGKDFIFVSYKSDNWSKVFLDVVMPLQEKYGLRVYCDKAFGQDLDSWYIQMQKQLEDFHCKGVLSFRSPEYLGSYATLLEMMCNRFHKKAMSLAKKPRKVFCYDFENVESLSDAFVMGQYANENTGLKPEGNERQLLCTFLQRFQNVVMNNSAELFTDFDKERIKNTVDKMLGEGHAIDWHKMYNYEFMLNTFKLTDLVQTFSPASSLDLIAQTLQKELPEVFEKEEPEEAPSAPQGSQDGKTSPSPVPVKKEEIFQIEEGCLVKVHDTTARKLIIPSTVTSIGESAFSRCEALFSVSIPHSVTSIGDSAFENCHNLSAVTVPNSVTTLGEGVFSNCSSLQKVTLPDHLSHLPQNFFMDCSSLPTVTLPSALVSIGKRAFYGCGSLSTIELPEDVTVLEEKAFFSCSSLSSFQCSPSLTTIHSKVFQQCNSLLEVYLPQTITQRSPDAFPPRTVLRLEKRYKSTPRSAFDIEEGELMGMVDNTLTHVEIPKDVTIIGQSVFKEMGSLESVSIPDSVTLIDVAAFQDCWNLQSVVIPDSVTQLEQNAFRRCTSLRKVTLSSSLTEIAPFSFAQCTGEWFKGVTIPSSVTTIGEFAFSQCYYLDRIDLPDSVEEVAPHAFECCSMAVYLGLSSGLTTLESFSFASMLSLHSVTVPASVRTIRQNAFSDCKQLKSVILLSKETVVEEGAFPENVKITYEEESES